MAAIWQVTWEWSGQQGLPGYTNLFYDGGVPDATGALAAATKSRLLWAGLPTCTPSGVVLSLVTDVRLLEETDGTLLDIFTVSGISSVTGTGGASGAGVAGGCIDWLTSTVHGTRRMQGRTFLVPLANGSYDSNGTLNGPTLTTIATAAEAMRTATGPTFGVWGRPRAADPDHVPPITARAGLFGAAISSRVPDKSVYLSSRRD